MENFKAILKLLLFDLPKFKLKIFSIKYPNIIEKIENIGIMYLGDICLSKADPAVENEAKEKIVIKMKNVNTNISILLSLSLIEKTKTKNNMSGVIRPIQYLPKIWEKSSKKSICWDKWWDKGNGKIALKYPLMLSKPKIEKNDDVLSDSVNMFSIPTGIVSIIVVDGSPLLTCKKGVRGSPK